MARPKGIRARREAFLRELEPHLDSLHRMAGRLAGDPTRADDLMQEALLKAWRFFETFKAGTNFRAWAHRVLYTVFVNTTRSAGPKTSALDAVAEPVEEPAALVAELARPTHREREQAILEASDERIRRAVDELPPELRTVFMLSTIEGLKYREIAEVMDCPLGTVMSRLFRSRRLLMDRLADYARECGFLKPGTEPDCSIDPGAGDDGG